MNELKLLKGDPIEIRKGLSIYPLTLSEISVIGEDVYNLYIRSFLLNKSLLEQLRGSVSPLEIKEVYNYNDLDFTLYMCSKDNYILYFFFEALKVFLKSEVSPIEGVGIFIKNENMQTIIDNELFLEIKRVIHKQNFLKDNDVSDFRPANSKAKELMEKLKKAKEKIQKQNNDDGLSLKDIISIVSTYSNDLNMISVWNLTVYQLYEAYLRLVLWDDYHNKFTLLPHTTDDKSLDIKHWAVDINKIKNN
jgi:hypothetical protein